MRPGRNDPCHCGSGKKYKRCCLDVDLAPALVSARNEDGILIGKSPIDTLWDAQAKRVRVIDSTIALRPPHESDHEFYVDLLCRTFGAKWHQTQLERLEAERHVIERWVDAWGTARSGEAEGVTITKEGEHLYSAEATGYLKALLCLAYDVYILRHTSSLPTALLERLKTDDQFQGARYEAAVAAVFARAGYTLEWLTDTDRKLPEFIARHPSARTEIAVEAKSRHRPGVLGREGEQPDLDALKVDVGGLMKRALEKETDGRPFIVCLDLNLPTDRDGDTEEWVAELHNNVLLPYGAGAPGEADPFSAVFFTNYSWHWDGGDPAGNPMSFVTWARNAAVSLPGNEIKLLSEAVFQYGYVPEATAVPAISD